MATRGRGQVVVFVNGDTSGLSEELVKAERQLNEFGSKTDKLGEKLTNAGKKMTLFASVPIAAAMGLATKSASDLEQSVGGIESVFGSAAETIRDFGDDAAQTAGLSKRQVNEMAAVVGASLKGMGFDADEAADQVVSLEKRAADMAATFGGTTEEAIQSVAAALRGERDPIEKYGVSIRQTDVDARKLALGLDTSTAAADKKATAIATLDLIMGQTADTEGQFAREADGAAGAAARARAEFENSAAEIGTHLLPIAAKGADMIGDLAARFGELPDPVQKGVIALAGILAASGPILTVAGNLVTLKSRLEQVDWAKAAAGIKGLGVAAGVAGAVFALKLGLDALGLSAQSSRLDIQDLAKATTEEMVFAFDRLNEFDGSGLETFERLAESNYGAALRLRDALHEDGRATEELDAILGDAAETQQRMAADTDRATDALKDEGATAQETEEALRDLVDATLAAFNADLRYTDATNQVEDAIAAMAEEARNGGTATEEYGRAMDDAAGAALGQAAAAANLAEKQAEATGSTLTAADSARIQRDELIKVRDTLAPGHPLRVRLDEWINRLNAVPGVVSTTAHLDTGAARAELAALQSLYREVPGFGLSTGSRGPAPRRRASGGPVDAGGTYLVGEEGPELLHMGGGSGRITPNHAIGSNQYFIDVKVEAGADAAEVGRRTVEAIREYERRNGTSWRSA